MSSAFTDYSQEISCSLLQSKSVPETFSSSYFRHVRLWLTATCVIISAITVTDFVQLLIILNYMAEVLLDRCHSAIKACSLKSLN